MTTPSSRRRAAPFVATSILCLLAGCSASGPAERAATGAGTMVALNDTQLGNIRGGFDVSPNLTINFGFQQITSLDNKIISSIVVPNITISPTSGRFSSLNQFAGLAKQSVKDATTSPLTVPTVVASGAAQTKSVAAAQPQSVATAQTQSLPANVQSVVASTQGATTVLNQISNGGFATIIGNTADNALIQHLTTIDISISGLTPLLAQGRSNAALVNALSLGSAQFR